MPAYSQNLRDRVLDALEREERPSRIAQRFVVSRSWVYQVRDRLLKDGKRTVLQVGGYRRSRIEHLQLTLSSWIQEQSDLTLEEICARLSELGIIHPAIKGCIIFAISAHMGRALKSQTLIAGSISNWSKGARS